MKKELYVFRFSVLLLVIVVVFACRKSVTPLAQTANPTQTYSDSNHTQKADTSSIPYPQAPLTGCSYSPEYGDSIIYPQPTTAGDYIVSPVNNPGPGTYMAWPQGLAINSTTGAIDITQSQTGERFDIGFVKSGTTDTCLSSLILAGASYMDSVYVIADGGTQAFPYFNANPYLASVCATNGLSGSCQFDVTGSAKRAHIFVDQNTGTIDLIKSLNSGAFGLLPLDGAEDSATIFYQLNDGSNMAMQHLTVYFEYYYSKSSINSNLLSGLTNKLNNILLNLLIMNTGNPRPPMIIITRFN